MVNLPRKIFSKCTPLCWLPTGHLVCYRLGKIIILEEDRVKRTFSVFPQRKESLYARIRALNRLLRLGIRASIALDDSAIIVSIGSKVYEINVLNGQISDGFSCEKGVRPLIISNIKDVAGFEDAIVFGGYLGNDFRRPVNIYKRKKIDDWEIVYTFPDGAINHVHNIIADPYRNCLWAFTGDFDEASAIWKITDNFRKVERVAYNDQKFRGCVAFALPEGVLYATDAPFAPNFIYLFDPGTMGFKKIFSIDGSCIYGCQWNDNYVFSSTVEGDGRNQTRAELLLGRKRGCGIKDNYVHLYCGNLNVGFNEIYKEKKDFLPLYSFQFGVFKFPYGLNNTSNLFFQPIATTKNDLNLMSINK